MTFCHGYFPSVVWYNTLMKTPEEHFANVVSAVQSVALSEIPDDEVLSIETEKRLELVYWALRQALGLPDDYWDDSL